MCTHLDAVEGAVILMIVVVLALLNGTFNALVCKAVVHAFPFLSFCTVLSRTLILFVQRRKNRHVYCKRLRFFYTAQNLLSGIDCIEVVLCFT